MSDEILIDTLAKFRPDNIVKGGPYNPASCEECFRKGWLDRVSFGSGYVTNDNGMAELSRHGF